MGDCKSRLPLSYVEVKRRINALLSDFDERNVVSDGYLLRLDDRIYGVGRCFFVPPGSEGLFPYTRTTYFLPFKERVLDVDLEVEITTKFRNFTISEDGMRGAFLFFQRLKKNMPIAKIRWYQT
jgi:hypothetical protein